MVPRARHRRAHGTAELGGCVELARPHGIPVMVRCRIGVPPQAILSRARVLVVYSGGKYLRGPQSTGLLIGEAKWIAAASLKRLARIRMAGI